jgi:hypothetical protein
MLGHFFLAFVILLNLYKKKQPIMNSYTLHDQQLEHVTTAKYLGVSTIINISLWRQKQFIIKTRGSGEPVSLT